MTPASIPDLGAVGIVRMGWRGSALQPRRSIAMAKQPASTIDHPELVRLAERITRVLHTTGDLMPNLDQYHREPLTKTDWEHVYATAGADVVRSLDPEAVEVKGRVCFRLRGLDVSSTTSAEELAGLLEDRLFDVFYSDEFGSVVLQPNLRYYETCDGDAYGNAAAVVVRALEPQLVEHGGQVHIAFASGDGGQR
jgi:hypothetical protein